MGAAAKALGGAYNESPFGYADRMGFDLEPARPIPEARLQRREARTRQTRSEHRSEIYRNIVGILALLADPENGWRRDLLEMTLGRSMIRYRLAISAMRCEVRAELPREAKPAFLELVLEDA